MYDVMKAEAHLRLAIVCVHPLRDELTNGVDVLTDVAL
jgi:hypothetical protein